MYIEHISGRRQYIVPTAPLDLPGAIDPTALFPLPGEQPDTGPAETREEEVAPLPPTDPVLELENDPVRELDNDTVPVLENNPVPVLENAPAPVLEDDPALAMEDPDSDTSTGTVLLPLSLSPSNFE